jgi:hypothetical protein
VDGFDYHKLLNVDNTKAKGVGADEICLFLAALVLDSPTKQSSSWTTLLSIKEIASTRLSHHSTPQNQSR